MQLCPICGNEVKTGLLCQICGFDESRDVERFATLAPLEPKKMKPTAKQREAYILERKKAEYQNSGRMKQQAEALYEEGLKTYNLTQRADKFYLAAVLGYAPAQNRLGECFYYGQGVSQNDSRAVEWFWKAAGQINPEAQYNLANCFFHGHGVTKNNTEAARWYKTAAEQGHPRAQYMLARCFAYGWGVPQSHKTALCWYQRAAEQGEKFAQVALGDCYNNGIGVQRNPDLAEAWYQAARLSTSSKKHGGC